MEAVPLSDNKNADSGFWSSIKGFFIPGPSPSDISKAEDQQDSAPESYHGGPGGGSGFMFGNLSDGSKFFRGISGSGRSVTLSHFMMRQNARSAFHENVQARAIVERQADSVAGTGLRLEATPKADLLGKTQEEAQAWARNVEARFDSWARSKKQHRAELMNFYQAQRLFQIMQHRDNDEFIRLYYDKDPSLLNPLQFSFVDTNQIRGYGFTSTYGPLGLVDGIERDERGREIAYKIWKRLGNGKFEDITIPARSTDKKRIFMLHGFTAEYAGQGRGYSRLAHALQEFQNLTDFSLATIIKAINQSNIVAKVKPSDTEDAVDPLGGVNAATGIRTASSVVGSSPCPDGDAQNVTAESLLPVTNTMTAQEIIPGSTVITTLPKGMDMEMMSSSSPADKFDTFVDAFTSYITAATGMPLEVMLMRFNQNFSASRASLLLFWRIVQIWRDEMAAEFLNPVYEMWLSEEIAAGRISAPGWNDPRLKAAWMSNQWIGDPPPDIDPSKTAKAVREYMSLGLLTGKRAARNLNGTDFDMNVETLTQEFGAPPPPPWIKNPEAEREDEIKEVVNDMNNESEEEK